MGTVQEQDTMQMEETRKGQRREKPVQGEETVGGCVQGWNKGGGREREGQ